MNYKVRYGKTDIEFILDRRNRKTLAIHVYPDKHVEVIAPETAELEKILLKVTKRASWIYKKQLEFDKIQPSQPKPRYQTGETFRYIGRQYRLKVLSGNPEVKLKNGRIHLICPESSDEMNREKLLLEWYRTRGKIIFSERFTECIKAMKILGIDNIPEWDIKVMPKRWGSCTKAGKIFLNPELVSAPKKCIDYVILHELCHLVEHNHSRRFYRLLDKVYPEWKKWRDFLNENIEVRIV